MVEGGGEVRREGRGGFGDGGMIVLDGVDLAIWIE